MKTSIEKTMPGKEVRNEVKKKRLVQKLIGIVLGIVAGGLTLLLTKNWVSAGITLVLVSGLFFLYIYGKKALKKSERLKKIETVFPDFLQLMAGNLRAGMTIDRAMLLGSREEFGQLNKEIIRAGKDITTGKEIEIALKDMAERIGSEKINKTIQLIISGIKTGGNVAILLEETATDIRQREFVEKRAASNVLMYVIFIFVAVAVGAPALFGLSTVLVEILSDLLGGLPSVPQSAGSIPFTITSITISTEFIKWFSVIFIVAIDVLASLVLGLVSKGEEKEGIKYLFPLLIISLTIFFLIRALLSSFLAGFF